MDFLKKLKGFKLTPEQRKIVDIVVTCLQVAIIILAITVSAIVIANPIASSAKVGEGKTKLLPVLTDSMNGKDEYYETTGFDIKTRFKSGDLVIAKTPENNRTLKVGDIVTYVGAVNGYEALITHRIVEVIDGDNDGLIDTYVVMGDVVTARENLHPDKILAVYKSHLKGVGAAINWLQGPTNFLLVIVIPLALLFIYNIILVVRMVMEYKMTKVKESASETAVIDEEEIKRKAIEEYLAAQKAKEDAQE
ncbi:MAG: S26 family signal peptidase [Clostridia bacterium]|nr:S26 family signal peptidase [Clostridia bacterium]